MVQTGRLKPRVVPSNPCWPKQEPVVHESLQNKYINSLHLTLVHCIFIHVTINRHYRSAMHIS